MEAQPNDLPTTRRLVTDLISALQKPGPSTANPLDATAPSKELLLTLHVLFQNELLPALDLLDRGLITRLRLTHDGGPPDEYDDLGDGTTTICGKQRTSDGGIENAESAVSTYYVRSAQQQTSRSTSRFRSAAYEHTTYYEVRLDAWSCSCPAFAFSAFPAPVSDQRSLPADMPDRDSTHGWTFGGLTLGTDMPVCKHLLACLLVEHSSMFSHMVEECTVSGDEMAGWAAGWGD